MTKIAMIGAGSVTFVKKLLADILQKDKLKDATIALHDIDPERLETAGMMARWTASHFDAHPIIEEHLDRRAALAGADFVINMVLIGDLEGIRIDHVIPAKYGVLQSVGDTAGIGGIMRALRTIPFMVEMCTDMEELCPDAYLLNYTNPMSMLVTAVYQRFPKIKVIGLCHNVQNTARELAEYLGVDESRLSYECGGINHMTWFLKLKLDGKDAYPALREKANDPAIVAKDRVRFELFKQFGWFVSESSRHNSEYTPYFLRDAGETKAMEIPVSGTLKVRARKIESYKADRQRLLAGGGEFVLEPSLEYGADIIDAIVTNVPVNIYGNVPNDGLITNLPDGCCVEVPVMVDGNGFHPCHVGELPPELAGYCAQHVYVYQLAVLAALDEDRDRVYRSVLLDRNAPSAATIPQLRAMVDELIAAHGEALPPGLRDKPVQQAAG
jgi:alpha-galactosidase